MVSISTISNELLNQIILHLIINYDPAPTVKNLSLVCHRFRELSLPHLYRHIILHLTPHLQDRWRGIVQFLSKRPELRVHVRTITIELGSFIFRELGEEGNGQKAFLELLPLLRLLKQIKYD